MLVLGVAMAFGLIFVGAVNVQGLVVRALGWTIREVPVEEHRRAVRAGHVLLGGRGDCGFGCGRESGFSRAPAVNQIVFLRVVGRSYHHQRADPGWNSFSPATKGDTCWGAAVLFFAGRCREHLPSRRVPHGADLT